MSGVLEIFDYQLIDTKIPIKRFLISELVKAGAPVKVKQRENKFDISELKNNEIRMTGNLIQFRNPKDLSTTFVW